MFSHVLPRRWSTGRPAALLLAGLLITIGLAVPRPVAAQQHLHDLENIREVPMELLPDLEHTCGLTAKTPPTRPPAPKTRPTGSKASATIRVDYGPGFDTNPEAQAAFQRAVDTWATHIESTEEIVVDASFQNFDSDRILGGATPAYVFGDLNGETIIVAVNMLEAIRGDRVENFAPDQAHEAGDPEIIASFNQSRDDWHFGEGPPPPGFIDFESVVLHEIGHGLQYASTFSYNTGSGDYACSGPTDAACWGFGTGRPSSFDQLAVQYDTQDDSFVDLLSFPNDTQTLGDAVTPPRDLEVRFRGEFATSNAGLTNGPQPPILYTPRSWSRGSSMGHLDEGTYPLGTENALMTPQLDFGESARLPGPIVCGSLSDMGWPLGPDCLAYVQSPINLAIESSDALSGTVELSWFVSPNLDIDSYVVERQAFDGPFEPVATLPGSTEPTYVDENIGLGIYTYRLRFERGDGSTGVVEEQPTTEIGFTNVSSDLEQGDRLSSVTVNWTVPTATSGYEYVIERSRGAGATATDFEAVGRVDGQRTFTDTQLFPATYEYRVRAIDADLNSVVSPETRQRATYEGDAFITGPNPNPVRSGMRQVDLVVSASAPQEARIAVYNTLGQQVYETRITLRQSAAQRIQLPVNGLSSGIYFVRIEGDEFTSTQRMAVTR